MGDSYESTHGRYVVSEESTGNASAQTILLMMQTTDDNGTTDDDPNAEWELRKITANLSVTGTIVFYAVDGSGTATAITPTYYLSANSGLDLEVKIRAGAKMDVAYTTTGGGNSRVTVEAVAIHHSNSRLGMSEVN